MKAQNVVCCWQASNLTNSHTHKIHVWCNLKLERRFSIIIKRNDIIQVLSFGHQSIFFLFYHMQSISRQYHSISATNMPLVLTILIFAQTSMRTLCVSANSSVWCPKLAPAMAFAAAAYHSSLVLPTASISTMISQYACPLLFPTFSSMNPIVFGMNENRVWKKIHDWLPNGLLSAMRACGDKSYDASFSQTLSQKYTTASAHRNGLMDLMVRAKDMPKHAGVRNIFAFNLRANKSIIHNSCHHCVFVNKWWAW